MRILVSVIGFILISSTLCFGNLNSVLRQKSIRKYQKSLIHTIKLELTGKTFQNRIIESLLGENEFQKVQLGLPQEQYLDLIKDMQEMSIDQKRLHLDSLDIDVPLKNYYNAQYFGDVTVGSTQQKMSVMFDTGSSYIWFTSQKCSGCKQAGINDSFSCKNSKTCHELGGQVKLSYGSGDAKAFSITDTLGIGSFSVNKQYLLILEKLSKLKSFFGDGLLGMGFSSLGGGKKTLIDNLYLQKQITERTFSIYLGDFQNQASKPSALVIGGIDPQYIATSSQWAYCPVVSQLYWGVSIESFSLVKGTQKYSLVKEKPIADQDILQSVFGVIDSGTSIMTLDARDFGNLYKFFQNFNLGCTIEKKYGLIVCEESNLTKYPVIEISVCGNLFTLEAEKYIMCQGECYVLIEMLAMPVTILGDLFIREYYTVYKQDEPRQIGFVKAST